jgi:plastocyanin
MAHRAPGLALLLTWMVLLLGTACDDNNNNAGAARTDPQDVQTQVGTLPYSDKGTQEVRGAIVQRIDAENFAFAPTFLRGAPGQMLHLVVENTTTDTPHNLTLVALNINQDIPPNQAVEIDLTFPDVGGLLFLCKFHTSQGMNGQLLVGDATPQARP